MSELKNYSIFDIAKILIVLIDIAWKEGILAIEQVVENNSLPVLIKNAIRLAVCGIESKIVISIIDQYRNTQYLDEDELVKVQIIRYGIEDIFRNSSPYETLLLMASYLSNDEMVQLITLLDKSELEHNLQGLSWYQGLLDKNEKAEIRMQEVLKLDPDKMLELLIVMDSESVYFALKGSSIDIIRDICKKTGDFVGSILTKYLWCKEPVGVYDEVNYCQDKMAVASIVLKEHSMIQFSEIYEKEINYKIIKEITYLQQAQKRSYCGDSNVNMLKIAAMYSLGYRHGYYQELYYRLGLEIMRGKGKSMGQFKDHLNATVSDREAQNVIAAGFDLILNQTYDISTNATMYAAMRKGNLDENIQYYRNLINKFNYHMVVNQNDFIMLRRIQQPQTVKFMVDTYTTTEILRILVGQKCEDVIGIVYLLGDDRVKNIIEKYCEVSDIANIFKDALSNPLNDIRYMDTLDMLKYCSVAYSKLQLIYKMSNDELKLLVSSMDEHTLGIVLKLENGELKEKILRICPSFYEKLNSMEPVVVYSSECHNSLNIMKKLAEKIR